MLEKLFSIDASLLLYLQENVRNPILTKVLVFITTLGNGGFVFILFGALLLVFKKTRKDGILYSLALILNLLLTNLVLKNLFMRPRPYTVIEGLTILINPPHGYSFPSGHTSAAFCLAMILFFINKKASVVAFLFAVMMGFSRMYTGVHYPTDVLGGAITGVISALIVGLVNNFVIPKKVITLR